MDLRVKLPRCQRMFYDWFWKRRRYYEASRHRRARLSCHVVQRAPTDLSLTRFAPGQSDVEELWFLGSHTDIGGGYVKRGLADHSLEWMVEKANEHGLPLVNAPIDNDVAVHEATFNDSFSCGQGIAGLFTRGKFKEYRRVRTGDRFHWSVQNELAQFANVAPPLPPENMIAYAKKHTGSDKTIVV